MQTPRRATVRGYLHQGQRPHINFHGIRYTNTVLASTGSFLGEHLRIYYNSQDLRTVRAFAADGAEIGAGHQVPARSDASLAPIPFLAPQCGRSGALTDVGTAT